MKLDLRPPLFRPCRTAIFAIALVTPSLMSCGKGSKKIPGLENFHAGVISQTLYVSFLSTALNWDAGLSLPIPGLGGAQFSVAPSLGKPGTIFQVSIPLAAMPSGGSGGSPQGGLPDGRPLPDVRDGALPRWDIPLGGLELSVYLSEDTFGLFIPLPFRGPSGITLPFLVSVRIEDEKGNFLGKAYAVPQNVSGSGSGILILMPHPGRAPRAPAGEVNSSRFIH